MTTAVLRKELHNYIDELPDCSLPALKPLLSFLVEPPYSIEPASPEERAMINERIEDYEKDPKSWMPLESIK
ncbi:MAG: hypothetical protein LBI94_09895 [Treponema sp.]|jgi:hypothetical protein|nr:hypothetical protein [Treponema sp.]